LPALISDLEESAVKLTPWVQAITCNPTGFSALGVHQFFLNDLNWATPLIGFNDLND